MFSKHSFIFHTHQYGLILSLNCKIKINMLTKHQFSLTYRGTLFSRVEWDGLFNLQSILYVVVVNSEPRPLHLLIPQSDCGVQQILGQMNRTLRKE